MTKNRPHPPDPALYGEFLGALELQGIRLQKMDVEAVGEPPEPAKTAFSVSHNFSSKLNPEKAIITVELGVDFVSNTSGEERGHIRTLFDAIFHRRHDTKCWQDPTCWESFSNGNLPILIWPYFRELVHSTMNRMGWPALILPLLLPGPDHPAAKAPKAKPAKTVRPPKKKQA